MTAIGPNSDEDGEVERIVELLELQLNMSGSIQAARAFAIRQRTPPALVDKAVKVLSQRRRVFEDLEPAPIADDRRLKWYHGPREMSAVRIRLRRTSRQRRPARKMEQCHRPRNIGTGQSTMS